MPVLRIKGTSLVEIQGLVGLLQKTFSREYAGSVRGSVCGSLDKRIAVSISVGAIPNWSSRSVSVWLSKKLRGWKDHGTNFAELPSVR